MSNPIDEAVQWLELHREKRLAIIEVRIVADLLLHIEQKGQAPKGSFASEMNTMIREITSAINGEDEPAFLDEAVRHAITLSMAAQRETIARRFDDLYPEWAATIRAMTQETRDE